MALASSLGPENVMGGTTAGKGLLTVEHDLRAIPSGPLSDYIDLGAESLLRGGNKSIESVSKNSVSEFGSIHFRDMTVEEGQLIIDEASKWLGTPYADQSKLKGGSTYIYNGNKAVRGVGADCTGSTWKIFNDSGFPYEYVSAGKWNEALQKGKLPFRELNNSEAYQVGDVLLFDGHAAIYAGDGNMWTAHRSFIDPNTSLYVNRKYDLSPIKYWNRPIEHVYRYQVSGE